MQLGVFKVDGMAGEGVCARAFMCMCVCVCVRLCMYVCVRVSVYVHVSLFRWLGLPL